MLKTENTDVVGWEHAIRGMRNPMNSWEKSDSYWGLWEDESPINPSDEPFFFVGPNDLDLMVRLRKAGADHRKFMRMLTVYVDITAPLYWWPEYDTYKVGTVANSCSRMHKLLGRPFEVSDFSFDRLAGYKREVAQFRPPVDEETEVWRKINEDYEVSNQGRVRHGKRVLSGSRHQDGYIFVTIHGKQIPAHKLVAKAFVPNTDNKPEVNHKDGNKQNCWSDNLEWVTRAENQKHAVNTGLQPKGLSTYKGKFSPEQREAIKKEWDAGLLSRRKLAEKYGVSHTCISDIVNDKYKCVKTVNLFEEVARPMVDALNELRDAYLASDDEVEKKEIWYAIIQLLPESYNQKRTVMLNYEVLTNMYHARKNHKLDEWHELCRWIEKLPYAKELIVSE